MLFGLLVTFVLSFLYILVTQQIGVTIACALSGARRPPHLLKITNKTKIIPYISKKNHQNKQTKSEKNYEWFLEICVWDETISFYVNICKVQFDSKSEKESCAVV